MTRKKVVTACVATALLAGGGSSAVAAKLITSKDVRNNTLRSIDIKNRSIALKDLTTGTQRLIQRRNSPGSPGGPGGRGGNGPSGPTGGSGPTGNTGPAAGASEQRITALTGAFTATNDSVSMTADGVEFGPYADAGVAGGSLYYSGFNGRTLAEISTLVYRARYRAESNPDLAVPYLRIFLENDTHDVIFSPNTQPGGAQGENTFNDYVVSSGTVRYDDDPGNGPDQPYATVVANHGDEVVSGIYITQGFSGGTDADALLRSLTVNNDRFVFGS